MQELNAKYTLWQLIRRLVQVSNETSNLFANDNCNVLLIRGVDPNRVIYEDFDFNGEFSGQSPYQNLTQGEIEDIDLETIDFTKENIKIVFSKDVITNDFPGLFNTNLIYRIQGMVDGVIETRTTRSRYGESVTHHLVDLNEQ